MTKIYMYLPGIHTAPPSLKCAHANPLVGNGYSVL